MNQKTECIFCKIVKGEVPCHKIYEDEVFLAFLDAFPLCEGHTLIIPKRHYRWVWDVENIGEYFSVCQKVANHYKRVLKIDLIICHIYGEEVPHAHIQLFPALDGILEKLGRAYSIVKLARGKLEEKEGRKLAEKLRLFSNS
jgi:histidine triad (HIT) family protein